MHVNFIILYKDAADKGDCEKCKDITLLSLTGKLYPKNFPEIQCGFRQAVLLSITSSPFDKSRFDADTIDQCPKYANLRKQRGFVYEDEVKFTKENLDQFETDVRLPTAQQFHPSSAFVTVLCVYFF
ncbi:hypothetical protein PoB_005025600 [Plakobranchus ocellatus]|uniref:Uncharacterized protein n=1 Tax=Plakobranchus ocellatus TaxID=259542 RepID=A0AAV4BTG2_9GAST|nr:hypothetical protein PoB_005025600 [Plakobranchus ocellatus]